MTAPSRLRERLAAAADDVARRQWAALGAASVATPGAAARATSIVDPEALIHLTAALAPVDRELASAAAGWMTLHSTLLSVQRVNNLAADFPAAGARPVAELARAAAHDGKDGRWKALALGGRGRAERTPRPRRAPAPAIQRRFTSATALVLQLRLGMGVGAKADVLAYLLGVGRAATAPEIAATTGYTVVAVRRAADEMASARFVHAGRRRGATDRAATVRTYAATPAAWATVLAVPTPLPPWRGWKEAFALVADFLDDPRLDRGAELLARHAAVLDLAHETEDASAPHADTITTRIARSLDSVARWMLEAV
ncbi:MAG TPA: hypothetical protein VFJ74_04540 [Gemmatimonadaceae bacterium]|nr:hypothetical protein [Gemmatimonadaceae bacterium]